MAVQLKPEISKSVKAAVLKNLKMEMSGDKKQLHSVPQRFAPDWFWSNGGRRELLRRLGQPAKAENLISFLWPASQDYLSPLNPLYLAECLNFEILNQQPIWLVREGLVPLLWFFKMHPTPEGFRSRLLIEEDFTPFVPTAWRTSVGCYRIENVKYPFGAAPDRIIFTALVNEHYCSLEHVRATLKKAIDVVGIDEMNRLEKICCFLPKYSPFGNGDRKPEFYMSWLLEVCATLGLNNLKPVNFSTFETNASFEDCYVVELNDKSVFVDSYMTHAILKRGGQLMQLAKPKNMGANASFVQLSPYHGISYQEKITGEYKLDMRRQTVKGANEHFMRFEQLMRSEANLDIPWATWFVTRENVAEPRTFTNN